MLVYKLQLFGIYIFCCVTAEVVNLHCLGYFCAIYGIGCVDSCDTCLLGWPVKNIAQQCPEVFIGDRETTANRLAKQKLFVVVQWNVGHGCVL